MNDEPNSRFTQFNGAKLLSLAQSVAVAVGIKNAQYEASWKKRGGVSAFMMLARKWDRIEAAAARHHYDAFQVLDERVGKDDAADDFLDLIGYLLLCLAERPGLFNELKTRLESFIGENASIMKGT